VHRINSNSNDPKLYIRFSVKSFPSSRRVCNKLVNPSPVGA